MAALGLHAGAPLARWGALPRPFAAMLLCLAGVHAMGVMAAGMHAGQTASCCAVHQGWRLGAERRTCSSESADCAFTAGSEASTSAIRAATTIHLSAGNGVRWDARRPRRLRCSQMARWPATKAKEACSRRRTCVISLKLCLSGSIADETPAERATARNGLELLSLHPFVAASRAQHAPHGSHFV